MAHHKDSRLQECLDRCQACEQACIECVTHCLQKGGSHAQPDHISLLLACAEMCRTSARLMLLGSSHHVRTCEVCAEICDACANDCETLGDDEMMQRCADMCRRCAESCRQMVMSRA